MTKREIIASMVREQGMDGVLLTSNAVRYYAVGSGAEGITLITAEGRGYALTDSRYREALEQAAGPLGFSVVLLQKNLIDTISDLCSDLGIKRLGYEDDTIRLKEYRRLQSALDCELVPAGEALSTLRQIKSEDEIKRIISAQRIAERAFEDLLGELRPGRTERELAAFLDYRMASYGSQGRSFATILISGENTSKPHGEPGERLLKAGDFITVDFGARVDGYRSDMTRTVALGHISEEMERVYQTVLDAQLAGIEALDVGKTGAEVHESAHRIIRDAGYGDYFGHGLGHSLGVEIHERPSASPNSEARFCVGNILTVEPGIYLPGRFGVRIEDMIFLSGKGKMNLTRTPKSLLKL